MKRPNFKLIIALALALLLTLTLGCASATSAQTEITQADLQALCTAADPVAVEMGTTSLTSLTVTFQDSSTAIFGWSGGSAVGSGTTQLTCTFVSSDNYSLASGEANSFTINITPTKIPVSLTEILAGQTDAGLTIPEQSFVYGTQYPATSIAENVYGTLTWNASNLITWGTTSQKVTYTAKTHTFWDTHALTTTGAETVGLTVTQKTVEAELQSFRTGFAGSATAAYPASCVTLTLVGSDTFTVSTTAATNSYVPNTYDVTVSISNNAEAYSLSYKNSRHVYTIERKALNITDCTLGKTYNGGGQKAEVLTDADAAYPAELSVEYSCGDSRKLSGGLPCAAANDYSATISLADTDKYYTLTSAAIYNNLEILPKEITSITITPTNAGYNRAAQSVTVSSTDIVDGATLTPLYDGSSNAPINVKTTNNGAYVITADAGSNYTMSTTATANFTINPSVVSIASITNNNTTFSGTPQAAVVTLSGVYNTEITPADVNLSYSSTTAPTDAGTYQVGIASFTTPQTNYTPSSSTMDFTIDPSTVNLQLTDVPTVFTGETQEPSLTWSGVMPNTTNPMSVKYTSVPSTALDTNGLPYGAGSYTVEMVKDTSVSGNGNYSIGTVSPNSFAIARKTINFTLDSAEAVYNTEEQEPGVTITTAAPIPSNPAVTYNDVADKPKDADNYTVRLTSETLGDNYACTDALTFKITKRPLTATVKDDYLHYVNDTSTHPTNTNDTTFLNYYDVTGWHNDISVSGIVTGGLKSSATEVAGTSAAIESDLGLSTDGDKNYTLAFVSGKFVNTVYKTGEEPAIDKASPDGEHDWYVTSPTLNAASGCEISTDGTKWSSSIENAFTESSSAQTVTVRMRDATGGKPEYAPKDFTVKLDMTAPADFTVAMDNPNFTNTVQSVTVGASSDTYSGMNNDYRLVEPSSYANATAPSSFDAQQNVEYTVTLKDNAGNTKSSTVTVTTIDKAAPTQPTISSTNSTVSTKGSVELTATAADVGNDGASHNTADAYFGLSKFTFTKPDGTTQDVTVTTTGATQGITNPAVPFLRNGDYTVTATDKAGNVSVASAAFHIGNIDTVSPVPADQSVTSDPEQDKATNGDVTLSYSFKDTGKDAGGNATDRDYFGLASATIEGPGIAGAVTLGTGKTDGADELTDDYVVSQNGEYVFKLTDKADNDPTVVTFMVKNIDVEKPVLGTAGITSPTVPTQGPVSIGYSFKDVGLDSHNKPTATANYGIKSIKISGPGFSQPEELLATPSVGDAAVAGTINVLYNGTYTFTVTDLAGNVGAYTHDIGCIDNEKPVITPATPPFKDEFHTSAARVEISFSASDVGKDGKDVATTGTYYGIARVEYYFESDTANTETLYVDANTQSKLVPITFPVSQDGKYNITAYDLAGNKSDTVTIVMNRIDNEPPRIVADQRNGTLFITAKDNARLALIEFLYSGSPVRTVNVTGTEASASYSMTRPGRYTVNVYDQAGLSATYSVGNDDSDNDGLPDAIEADIGSDPNNPDTDGDGLKDGDEYYKYKTSPINPDSDGDGLGDGLEIGIGFSPLSTDSDNDGIPDGLAYQLGAYGPGRLNAAGELLLGDALIKAGEKAASSPFADESNANELLDNLISSGLISEIKGGKEENLSAANKAIKQNKGAATLVQFDENTGSGLALCGDYLIAFERNGNKFKVVNAWNLAAFGGSGEWVILPSADGSIVTVARWDGNKITGELGIISLVTGRMATVNGAAGADLFAMGAQGTKLSYVKDGKVAVLDLANAKTDEYPVENLVSVGFESNDNPIGVTANGKVWRLSGDKWVETTKDLYDMQQRTNNGRKLSGASLGDETVEIASGVRVLFNRGELHMNDKEGKDITVYDLGKNEAAK